MTTQRLRPAAVVVAAAALAAALALPVYGQEVVVPLAVNEVARGEVVVRIAGDDIMMRVADLEAAGFTGQTWQRLRTFGGMRAIPHPIGDAEAVSLRSLAPLVSYKFDESTLSLALAVDARLLTSTAMDLLSNRPDNIEYARDDTTFLNYSLTSNALKDVGVFGEFGQTIRGALLYTSFSRVAGEKLVRGNTNLTIDSRTTLRRWVIGDEAIGTDAIGGAGLVGGVTVSRNFDLDPYFVRYPSLQLRGIAQTPSQVEVYVNGLLVDRRQVNPGEFELRNLPVSAGTGVTQVVVRDVYGNERIQSDSYYYSTAVLARGMNEYTYSAGLLREGLGLAGDTYGDPALIAFHRRGLTDYITGGFRAELTEDVRSVGPNLAIRTRYGDLELLAGASDARGLRGTAGQVAYNYITRRFSAGAIVRGLSRDYATLSLSPAADRALLDASVYAATLLGRRTSLTAQFTSAQMRDAEDTRRIALISNVSLGRYMNAFLSVGGSEVSGDVTPEYTFGISLHARQNISASIYAASRDDQQTVSVELQRPLPVGTGYGFRIGSSLSEEGDRTAPTLLQYQADFGRYEVALDALNSNDPTITASGGLVYGAGSLIATRPVQDSYAIVRVPGVEGVRVYASNQLIGRTNRRGALLVPSLLAYYGNQLRINDEDVPLDYDVAEVEKVIAPPYRGGAIVNFPVKQVRTITGSIRVRGAQEAQVPAYGELKVTRGGQSAVSPLGTDGEFYLENLESGQWSASVEWEHGSCTFELSVPETAESFVRLGTVSCDGKVK